MSQSTLKTLGSYGVAGSIGAGLGYIGAALSKRGAQAAVDVRPSLADVGFVDALFASHATDWLYYQYPTEMTAFNVVLATVVFIVCWWWVRNQ